jgi:hypothetical protein
VPHPDQADARQHAHRVSPMRAALQLPDPFDLHQLCRRLGDIRRRQLVLVPVYTRRPVAAPGPPTVAACLPWFEADDTDYVLHEQNTTALHRQLLALHAIGHLLLRHPGREVPADRLITRHMPDLDWQRLRPALGPTVLVANAHAEAEADEFALGVLHRAGLLPIDAATLPAEVSQ